jgi:polyhydroxyalkanoate synthase
MKGVMPKPFDLLYWNSDSTRLPAKNHSFYLRNFYIQNKLAKGQMVLDGIRLDLKKVKIPIYSLATKEDHIAPAASVFRGAKLFGGPVRYVYGGSGHIAGVINPPAQQKYSYATGPHPSGTLEDWLALSQSHEGSWWPDWYAWLSAHAPDRVPAREPGTGALPALADAPGTYVRIKS